MTRSGGRVLRIAQVVRPASGGIRSHVRTLVLGLDRLRFASTIYGPSNLDVAAACAPHIPTRISPRLRLPGDLASALRLAARLRNSADIVHAHGLRAAAIGIPASRLAGIPVIFTAHNLAPQLSFLQAAILRGMIARTGRVVAVSQAVAATLSGLGIPLDRLAVIPNGIDLDPFRSASDPAAIRAAYNIPATAPLIVAVGRLSHEKGMDVLLDAYRQMGDIPPGASLIIAGDGPDAEILRAKAVDGVHFAGRVTNVAPLLQAADVVAIPSRLEGQGIVALEAMAAAKPVVASRIGGLQETVLDGDTGLLVPVEDAASLAETLSRLLAAPEYGDRLGRAGRERVEQRYTAEHMIATISALYDTIGAVR